MKKTLKRVATLFLAASLVAGSMVSAFASDSQESNTYLTNGNVLTNAGFEASTEVTQPRKDTSYENAVMTEGWTTAYASPNNKWSLSNDPHRGNNSLKLELEVSTGNNNTSLVANYNLAGEKPLGRTRLEPDTTYVISYWAKGNAKIRFWSRVFKVNNGTSTSDTEREYITKYEDLSEIWKLYTAEVTTNSLGEIRWQIDFRQEDANIKYAIVDDVAVQKKADAISSVEAMIEGLDVKADGAERAINDITQWCEAMGSENINNYNDFLNKITPNQYLTNGNVLTNAGFEASTEVTQPRKDTSYENAVMTEGWTTAYASPNNKWSLSNDPHRGNNSLKLELEVSTGNNNTSLVANYNLAGEKPLGRTRLEPDTTYVISYWAKGNAKIRFWSRVFKVNNGTSTSDTEREYITKYEDLSEIWKLYTAEVTTNSLGEIRWQIDFRQEDANVKYAIVDDVAVQKKADAIRSVEAMIEGLDVTADGAERAIDDIAQWCEAIGTDKITNYDVFLRKTSADEQKDPLIATYTKGKYTNLKGKKEAPTKDGYVFTGWFINEDVVSEENMKKYVLKADTELGEDALVYARFVDARMLDVKAQLNGAVGETSEKAHMRFLTTVDNLAYNKIGFIITINSKERDTANSKVYRQLSDTYINGQQEIIEPNCFYKNSQYFKAYTITNIPKDSFDVSIAVTPYLETLDGTRVYGQAVTKTVNQGIAAQKANGQ